MDINKLSGKDIQSMILDELAYDLQKDIDRELMKSLWPVERYNHIKTWKARNGTKMHRIECNDEVWDWLRTEHDQYGVSNPDWWVYDRKINITDKLYSLLVLRWAE